MGEKMRNRKKAERSNLILQIEIGRERRISRSAEGRGRDPKKDKMREIWREQYRSVIIIMILHCEGKKHRG
jgi:hypothetical protein